MTKRFICFFDDTTKKWVVQNTDTLDVYYVADKSMGKEFAHLLNLYHQELEKIDKENWNLKQQIKELQSDLKIAKINSAINRMAQRPMR